MGGKRGRGRFPVGASDDHDLARRRYLRPFAEEELDIADHLDARFLGAAHAPMRLRMRQGNAGGKNESGKARPVGGGKIAHGEAWRAASSRAAALSSHRMGLPPPALRARAEASPLSPSPKTATSRPAKMVTGIMLGRI